MTEQNITESEGKKKRPCGCYFLAAVFILFLFICFSIALPGYLRFPRRAAQSEAKQNLGAIYTSQIAYHAEFGVYASGENCFELIPWTLEGRHRYSYYCGKDKIACAICDGKCPAPDVPEYKEGSFTVFAVGNIDKDKTCDVWTINDVKKLININSDIKD